jgi:protein O-GlcNAc transferase
MGKMSNKTNPKTELINKLHLFKKIVRENPNDFSANYNLGTIYFKLNKFKEAVKYLTLAVTINPNSSLAYNNLGLSQKNSFHLSEALDAFKKASDIDPKNFQAFNNLGSALIETNDFQKAIINCNKALKLKPDFPGAWENLGLSYQHLGKTKTAIKYFKKAISLNPILPTSHYSLGIIYNELGLFSKAAASLEKTIEIDKGYWLAYLPLYMVYRQLCLWEKADDIKSILDKHPGLENPWISIGRDDNPSKNYHVSKIWSQNVENRIPNGNYDFTNRQENKKIRLGYFSADFREHPIGIMVASMFGYHNRSKFEVYAYSYGNNDKSIWRKNIQKGVDQFRVIRDNSDQQIADIIYQDNIDILIDLTGYTKGNRLEVCAKRPAPIQITYLGHPGTSGASFLDYVIADKIVIPTKDKKYFSEKIIYMPHCYQINNSKLKISDKKLTRKSFGLPLKGFVFACFNQFYKIDQTIWNVWMNILKQVPESVLWLWNQSDESFNNLIAKAQAAGINPNRIISAKGLPKEEHLKRLSLADLGLDTLVYGGHTTTSDMLWAGIPVVTKTGNHFASRVCTSILTEAKLPELITTSLKEYEEKAIYFSQHPKELKLIKNKIDHKHLLSNLFSTKRFVLNLEKAYEEVFVIYRNKEKPRQIEIK